MQYAWRYFLLAALLMVGIAGLIWRMAYLNVMSRPFLIQQGQARTLRIIDIPAYRGMITDRNGVPLAVSTPVDSVWVNPQLFDASADQLVKLAALTGLSIKNIAQHSNKKSGREFIYLVRGMPPSVGDQIKALQIPGVFFQREYRRYYPAGEVTAHVVGFTNIDDNGQEGLELAYNHWLRGVPGKTRVIKDRLGQIVDELGVIQEPEQGRDLTLSLDSRLQYLAYSALKTAVAKYHADSGSAVVLDIKTGEILAMVNAPSFNPNLRLPDVNGNYRNRAVTDMFEPGSIMKTFSLAAALSTGRYTPKTIIDTRPGYMEIDGYTIRDDGDYGVINVTGVLQHSSNIGAAKIALSLPPLNLWNMYHALGFGFSTDSGFPGEVAGTLIKERFARRTNLATMAYGYGLSVTALQLVDAYATVATGGIKIPMTFLKTDKLAVGQRVMTAKVAQDMQTMLGAVTQEAGTGKLANIPGYQVGGKTGTAYMAGPKGYIRNHYESSFIGIAPLSHPRFVVAVMLHDVKGNVHLAALVAAPEFSTIMGGALRYYNIPPDKMPEQPSASPR